MKVAYISTYPPRRCGIGTYTQNLIHSVSENIKNRLVDQHAMVVAMDEDQNHLEYPEEVKYIIRANHQEDYVQASRFINFSGASLCVLQHEFGIFGGDQGVFLLPLIKRLQIPLLVTFHTVLKNPSYVQKAVIKEIGMSASKVTVMSNLAVTFLRDIYGLPLDKVHLIEHGVPDFEGAYSARLKEKYGFEDRKIILTFGLLGRNKGIETVLHALASVVKKHPEVLYIILGKTHPWVLRISGEEYREYLKMLVKKYELKEHVYFYDQFVKEEELMDYLTMSDIYITPYLAEEQITSGTLSYAVGAGSCVLSTPYWHAKELLDKGRGMLFDFKNHFQLANILNNLLDHPQKIQKYRKKAFEYGKKIRWLRSGHQYLHLYRKVKKSVKAQDANRFETIDITLMPSLNLDHIMRLTDDTGILRYAKYGIPRFKGGYSLNDNARALLMSVMYYDQRKDRNLLDYMLRYLSYIDYMQNGNGTFRNHLSFNRKFRDKCGTEDAFGRAIWALGYLVRYQPTVALKLNGKEIFLRSVHQFLNLRSLRGIANTTIGISFFLREYSLREEIMQCLGRLVSRLKESYKQYSTPDWLWFENKMTYDNGIIPLALLHSYRVIEDEEVLEIAKRSLDFLIKVTFHDHYYKPIGSRRSFYPNSKVPGYNQESTEAMSMILLLYQAYRIFHDNSYLQKLFSCYLWYLGENQLNIPLYDHESGGCYQGLTYRGVNKNEGAEGTLAYLIAHLTVLKAHEEEHFQLKNYRFHEHYQAKS